jgi:hypothetical protein
VPEQLSPCRKVPRPPPCRVAPAFPPVSAERANLRCRFVRCGTRRRVPSRPLRLRPVSGARFARTSATATWAKRTQPGCGSKICPQTLLPERATQAGARRRVERMTRLRPVAALGCILCHRGTKAYAASRRANMASPGPLRNIVLLGECGRLRPCRLPAARRVLGSCAGGSRASPTTRRLGNARASSQAGSRCHCGRSGCRNRRGHGECAAGSRLDGEPGRKPSTAIDNLLRSATAVAPQPPHRTPPFGRHGKSACRKVGCPKSRLPSGNSPGRVSTKPMRGSAGPIQGGQMPGTVYSIQRNPPVATPAALSTRTSIAHLLPPIAPTNPPRFVYDSHHLPGVAVGKKPTM